MPVAAVPNYIGSNFQTASPSLRFGMYLPIWQPDWSKEKNTASLLKDKVCALSVIDKRTLTALRDRQTALAGTVVPVDTLLIMDAQSIAPFSTGLGNEHPLENGFAFLNPYGLPYLPGSGVKGVLRQAAQELADGQWGDIRDWTKTAISALFGHQAGETELVRGALSFWDVIPQLAGDTLAVDIMTPHQSHYYQDGETPHESGKPNPISFLTVPPKSGFVFYVQCDVPHLQRLAPELAENNRWRELLESAFEHAFDWLGFGAKTSVGYGAMRENPEIAQQRAAEKEKLLEQQKAAAAQLVRDALPSDQRLLAELDTELQKLPRNPQDNTPIRQQTSTQHWQSTLAKLQEQSTLIVELAAPARELLATEVKKRLLPHFKVEGKAEKVMKQVLAVLRGTQ